VTLSYFLQQTASNCAGTLVALAVVVFFVQWFDRRKGY
jgi:hypothetical protein